MRTRLLAASLSAVAVFGLDCTCAAPLGASKEGSISGAVIKGPVNAAHVTAFSVSGSTARRGDKVGEVDAGADGTFTINVKGYAGPALVCATGGTYTEEATGGLAQLGATELCALVDDVPLGEKTTGVLITPFTTFHAGLTACFLESQKETTFGGSTTRAALRLNDFLSAGQSGFDFRKTAVFDTTSAPAPSLTPDVWHGILLAGLSESARQISITSGIDPGVRVTAATLASTLESDIDDGACIFDGLDRAAQQLQQGTVDVTGQTLRGAPQGLATSIVGFLDGAQNKSGVQSSAVSDFVSAISSHRSEIFKDTGGGDGVPPVITFTSPTASSTLTGVVNVNVTAVDQTAVTTCAFSQPQILVSTGAVISADTKTCTLAGVLNTTTLPDGPLTITVIATDDGGNSATQDLRVTVNNSVPTITVTAPSDGGTVTGTVTIDATATSPDGILSITVAGAGPLTNTQPLPDHFTAAWDTTTSPEGDLALVFTATSNANVSFSQTIHVTVDNFASSTVSGVVQVGAPIAGASVEVLKYDGRTRGATVGTATTNDQGAYTVELPDNATGPLLVRVTNGSFVDVSSGVTLNLSASQELLCPVPPVAAGAAAKANVNSWTTLAAVRAPHDPVTIDDTFAITANLDLLSQHLRRPNNTFRASDIVEADLTTQVVQASDDGATLALADAGLSRLASEYSLQLGGSVGSITAIDLVSILSDDLAGDALLDGLQNGVTQLTLGASGQIEITSFTTRFDLDGAVDRFVRNVQFTDQNGQVVNTINTNRNNSGITRDDLLNSGTGFYEALAEDARTELYPAAPPPKIFDLTPPTVQLKFAGTAINNIFGDPLSGTVNITGTANDAETSITRFIGTIDTPDNPLPDSLGSDADGTLSVFIDTSVLPNGPAAADACPDDDRAADAAASTSFVCVCGLADDQLNNLGEDILCFTRPPPLATITAPGANSTFNGATSVTISSTASSGFNMQTCNVTLTAPGQSSPPLTSPTFSGTGCSFSQTLAAGSLGDATWTFTTTATDIAGTSGSASRTFVTDKTPPAVTKPTISGSSTGTSGGVTFARADAPPSTISTYTVSTTATDSAGVATVTFVITPTTGAPLQATGVRQGVTSTFSATVADNGSEGVRSVVAHAVDVNGNAADSAQALLTKDATPPSFAFLAPANQTAWKDQAPTAATTACTTVDADGFHMNCQAVATNNVSPVSSFYSATNTNPASTINIWRNNTIDGSSFIQSSPGFHPKVQGTPTDNAATTNSGISAVFYEAGIGGCPSVATTTRVAHLTADTSSASVELGFDPMAVVLSQQVGASLICLQAIAVDKAGNRSAPATIFFKWNTVEPPVNVLFNPFNDTRNNGGNTDFTQAAATDADNFIEGRNTAVRIADAYISNPFPFAILVKVPAKGDLAAAPITMDMRDIQLVSSTRADHWLAGSVNQFQSPALSNQVLNDNLFPDYGSTPNDAGTSVWQWNTVSADFHSATVTKLSDTLLTAHNTLDSDLVAGNMSAPTISYFAIDPTTGVINNNNAIAPDAQGFVTVPPATGGGFNQPLTAGVIIAMYSATMAGAGSTLDLFPPGDAFATVPLLGSNINAEAPTLPTDKYIYAGGGTAAEAQTFTPATILNVTDGSGTLIFRCGTAASGGDADANCKWVKHFGQLTAFHVKLQIRPTPSGAPTQLGQIVTKRGTTTFDFNTSLPVHADPTILNNFPAQTTQLTRDSSAP